MRAEMDLVEKPGYTRLEDVEYFKNRVRIGEELKCMVFYGKFNSNDVAERPERCRLLGKGRHTAQTTKGTMQWTLLTVWNKDKLRKYKEQDRAAARSGGKQNADSLYLFTVQGKR